MIAIIYPFFPQGTTRRQLLAQENNVQVKSCWNGMGIRPPLSSLSFCPFLSAHFHCSWLTAVSLNALPFQNETNPLQFRAIASSLSLQDGYLEGSEACLIHADMQRYFPAHHKTFLNPLVRVSYTPSAFESQNSILQMFLERIIGPLVAIAYDVRDWCLRSRIQGYFAARREKVREWERATGKEEVGDYCLIDQMQLLTPWGWAHV